MRKEDKCIWDKFGEEDVAKLSRLVDKADKLLEKTKADEAAEKQEAIPLEKVIARLRTDLKLASRYAVNCTSHVRPEVARKNKMKASALYWLEELQQILERKDSNGS